MRLSNCTLTPTRINNAKAKARLYKLSDGPDRQNCLAPVSFDLASAESIREKAHKWLGQLTSVSKAREDFKLYFLVGEPTVAELRPTFESALSILGKSSVEQEVVLEAKASELSERLATEVQAHERALGAG